MIQWPSPGNSDSSGGAALAYINGNGKLDLVLTSIDSPAGANQFWCSIGGGAAIADIDKNGILPFTDESGYLSLRNAK